MYVAVDVNEQIQKIAKNKSTFSTFRFIHMLSEHSQMYNSYRKYIKSQCAIPNSNVSIAYKIHTKNTSTRKHGYNR